MEQKTIRTIAIIVASILFVAFVIFLIYQVTTTYRAHETFEGYCKWRGLEVVSKTSNYGYCSDNAGNVYKMVMVRGRWFINGDISQGFPW
jgi:uncharacterized membrane protein YqiK